MYEIGRKGIPTKHKGVQFRSRLEVQWAIFFEALGWDYIYEPFDLEGWIPDFLLKGQNEVLVEVKPTSRFDEAVAQKCLTAASKAGWQGEVLLVGAEPFIADYHRPALGWLFQYLELVSKGYAHLFLISAPCFKIEPWMESDIQSSIERGDAVHPHVAGYKADFRHGWDSFEWRMSGVHIGDGFPPFHPMEHFIETANDEDVPLPPSLGPYEQWQLINHLWNEIKNEVQWKKPRT